MEPVVANFCESDGESFHKIGEKNTRELDLVPAKFLVTSRVTIKHGRHCCGDAPGQSSQSKHLRPKFVLSTTNLLAHVIYFKFEMHLLLFMQQQDYAKHGRHIISDVLARAVISIGTGLRGTYQVDV